MPDITIDDSKKLDNSRSTERLSVTLLPDPEPRPIWCPIISVDDHVLEPPDLFVKRMPSAMRDEAPRVEYDDEGIPYWIFDDLRLPTLPTDGAVGRPPFEWNRGHRSSRTSVEASSTRRPGFRTWT